MSEAIGVIHPFDRKMKILQRVANVPRDMAKLPPSATVHLRESVLRHYAAVAEDLEAKEKGTTSEPGDGVYTLLAQDHTGHQDTSVRTS
eukprot:10308559-Karenia_brevis.AAC.1